MGGETGASVTDAGAAQTVDPSSAWEAIRASGEIQFAPVVAPKQSPPPEWLMQFMRFLEKLFAPVAEALGVSWPTLKWILLAIVVVAALWLLWRLIEPMARIRMGKRTADDQQHEEWTPDRGEAIALLEDADQLAAEGRYDEAAHLLLMRSVSQIAATRPDWLEPSSTAREIASLSALPDRARAAFSTIAGHVERSLFALRQLDMQDWQAARAAYADFALADLRAGA